MTKSDDVSVRVCFNVYFFFFFQAEDGIRDWSVTGVQTCALPIWGNGTGGGGVGGGDFEGGEAEDVDFEAVAELDDK